MTDGSSNEVLTSKIAALEKSVAALELTLNHSLHKDGITLEKYFELHINELNKYFELRITELDKAMSVVKVEIDRRLEEMNEVRDQLRNQADTFVTLIEFRSFKDMVEKFMIEIRQFRDNMQGKASQTTATIALLLAITGIIIALLKFIL